MRELLDPQYRPVAEKAATFGLCAQCLGRTLAKVDTGLTNGERGEMLAKEWGLSLEAPEECHICEGLFGRLDELAEIAHDALDAYEFDNFLVGTRVSPDLSERDEVVWAATGTEKAEPMTSSLNREVGRRLVEAYDWAVEFKHPQIVALVDTRFDHVFLTFRGLCLYGRYRKHVRDIPQTHWPCRTCRGSKCVRCNLTGKQYATSVEELVAAPAIAMAGAADAKFHGSGREDVDALCLGTGRPFVLELLEPKRRDLDLTALREAINANAMPQAEVSALKVVEKSAIEKVKAARGGKVYEATVAFTQPVAPETLLTACEMLRQAPVAQRTPSRVSHRRADKVRKRNVARAEVQSHEPDGLTARILIQGDAGLYIKELLSGDDGRTEPSLAALVGTQAKCTALDVVAVEGHPDLESDQQHPSKEWN